MANIRKTIKKTIKIVNPTIQVADWLIRSVKKGKKAAGEKETVRTKSIKKGLKTAGLSDEEIERLVDKRLKKTFGNK